MDNLDKSLYSEVIHAYSQVYADLKEIKSQEKSKEDLADTVFVLNQILKWIEEMRKEVDRVKRLSERLACLHWIREESLEPIRTEYCTASPDIKTALKLPNIDSEQYTALMTYLNIPAESRALIRLSWKGVKDRISDSLANGKPLPKELQGETIDEFKLVVRKKREILNGETQNGEI